VLKPSRDTSSQGYSGCYVIKGITYSMDASIYSNWFLLSYDYPNPDLTQPFMQMDADFENDTR
jgi:hypothetical protein